MKKIFKKSMNLALAVTLFSGISASVTYAEDSVVSRGRINFEYGTEFCDEASGWCYWNDSRHSKFQKVSYDEVIKYSSGRTEYKAHSYLKKTGCC